MIVYKSGGLAPTENAALVEQLLLLARRYQNALIEVERARFGAARAECDAHPSVAVEAAALAQLRASLPPCTTPRDCTRDKRKGESDRPPCSTCEALQPARDRVAAARAAIWKTVGKAREEVDTHPSVQAALEAAAAAPAGHARMHKTKVAWARAPVVRELASRPDAPFGMRLLAVTNEIEARAGEYRRLLRSRCGLPYGTYLLVEAAVQAARASGEEPHFHHYDGSGRVGVQIQKTAPLTCAAAFGEQDTRLRIVRRPDPTDVVAGSSRHGRRAVVCMRVGSNGRAPVWATWPVILHRPLPPEGQIKWAWMQRRRVGPDYRWEFCVTVKGGTVARDQPAGAWTCNGAVRGACGAQHRSREAALRHCESDDFHVKKVHGPDAASDRAPIEKVAPPTIICDGDVAVDLGWRVRNDGLRAGYWRDEHGNGGEFLLPQVIREKIDHARSIGAIRRRAFDAFLPQFAGMLEATCIDSLPAWLRRQAATVRMWKSPDRLMRFFMAWRGIEPRGTSRARTALADWALQDAHLHRWEAHETDKALACRNDQYRVWSAWLARRHQHGSVVIEQFDQSKVAGRRGLKKKASKAEKVRADRASSVRQVVAAGKFKLALLNACGARGVPVEQVSAAWTTIDCATPGCGNTEPWDAAPQVEHRCPKCGKTWDQDEQACVNLLARRAKRASGRVVRSAQEPLAGSENPRRSRGRRARAGAPAVTIDVAGANRSPTPT